MMNEQEQDRLMDAIGEIDEQTVAQAHGRQHAAPVWRWAGAAAACVALALLAAVLLRPAGTNEPEKPATAAARPPLPPMPPPGPSIPTHPSAPRRTTGKRATTMCRS